MTSRKLVMPVAAEAAATLGEAAAQTIGGMMKPGEKK
jgi:hypothetical protein